MAVTNKEVSTEATTAATSKVAEAMEAVATAAAVAVVVTAVVVVVVVTAVAVAVIISKVAMVAAINKEEGISKAGISKADTEVAEVTSKVAMVAAVVVISKEADTANMIILFLKTRRLQHLWEICRWIQFKVCVSAWAVYSYDTSVNL